MERLIGASLATLAVLSLLALFKASVIALSVWLSTTWPTKSLAITTVYRERPGYCFLIGTVNTVVLGFIGFVLLSKEPLALFGLLLLATVAGLHLWGRVAAYQRMAVKMDLCDPEIITPRNLALGGIVRELSFLVPLLGQLLYLGTTLRAMGAAVVVLLSRKKRDTAGPPTAE